ncbi:hypothetical protein OC835_000985 [Tilletia horrida]|nr:hypothetical protein OC835_000985 [Tilletia horrida]
MAFTFGAAPAASTGAPAAAAAAAPAAFSFGASTAGAAATPAAPATTAGGLFGAKPATTTGGGGGGGLFGSVPAPATSTSASASASAAGTLFGGSAAAPATSQPAAAPGTFSLFGAKPAAAPTAAAGTTGTLGSSLFGAPAAGAAAGTAGKSLFGATAPAATTAAPAAPAAGFSFGQSQAAPAGALGASAAQQQQQQPQQQAQAQAQQAVLSPASQQRKLGSSLSADLAYIHACWNISNPSTCSFVYYFYNNYGPEAVQALLAQAGSGGWTSMRMMELVRRRDALGPVQDAMWEAAVRQNPDPTRLVPILAVGFPDLAKRRAAQQAESERIAATLATCTKRATDLANAHSLSTTSRLETAQRRQTALHARVLGLARRYWRLLESGKAGLVAGGAGGFLPGASSASSSAAAAAAAAAGRFGSGAGSGGAGAGSAELQRQDERTREVLEACNAMLNGSRPGPGAGASSQPYGGADLMLWTGRTSVAGLLEDGGGPPLADKMAELWPKVAQLSARRGEKKAAAAAAAAGARANGAAPASWAVANPRGLEEVGEILVQQQAGLTFLMETVKKDKAVVGVLTEMLEGVRVGPA